MDRSGSLAKRAYQGLAQLLFVLAACVFGAAWSLAYWQGWLFLCVFGGAVTLITAHFLAHDPALIERRLKAGATAETQPRQKLVQAVASVVFLALLVVPGLDHRFGWSHVPVPVAVAGDVLVALGLLIVFFVFRANSYTSAVIEVGTEQTIVTTGPYRFVRHPMYAGALLLILGIPLALGSLWGLLICLAMVVTIVARLLDEERYLASRLPGYPAYCATTRYRLVPGIF
jgi:protein-S-isoprenylcysteine O-methyltransferase Ste14